MGSSDVAVFLGCIEKYINILDGKAMSKLLKSVYARIHDRQEDDQDLQDFFKFKCWIWEHLWTFNKYLYWSFWSLLTIPKDTYFYLSWWYWHFLFIDKEILLTLNI